MASFGNVARVFMALFYTAAGLAFLFTDLLSARISEYRTVIGAVLLGYGILRLVLWIRARRSVTDHDQ